MKKLFVAMMTACLLSCTALTVPAWAAPGKGSLTIIFDDHITKVVSSDFEFTTSGQFVDTSGNGGGSYRFDVSLENGYVIDEVTSDNSENPIGLISSSYFYISDSPSGPLFCTITITSRLAKSYTVTFKDWDGEVLKTEEVTEGSGATAPTSPTRDYYTFTGWNKPFDEVTEDLTVTATYTEGFSGDCETCTGSGKVSGPCSLCNGLGSRDCPDCENGTSFGPCSSCYGNGYASVTCPACGGIGILDPEMGTVCTECNGSSFVEESCSQCSGSGQEAQDIHV